MLDNNTFVSMITGAGSGIGQAIAKKLANAGNKVVICDQNSKMLLKTEEYLENNQSSFKSITMDISDKYSLEKGFNQASKAFGKIDHLINNAGRPLIKNATEVTWEEWDEVMDVNMKGAYFLSVLFAKEAVKKNHPAAIVNIASTHGLVGISGRSVYGISKGGLIQMSRMLAIEWAELNIRVNSIAPTTVLTPSREISLPEGKKRDCAKARIPQKRFPEADEIASAVYYLLSSDAQSITGHTLAIDGGLLSE